MKTFNIEIPEGYEIDKEKSTFEKIVFKLLNKECNTWEEIIDKYEKQNKTTWFIENTETMNTLPSEEITEQILALCQLHLIADYYNNGWKPDWNNFDEDKWYVHYNFDINHFCINYRLYILINTVHFKSKELAEKALKYNEEIFKKAYGIK